MVWFRRDALLASNMASNLDGIDVGPRWTVRSWRPKLAFAGLVLLLVGNAVAFNHAWSFTHFSRAEAKTARPETLSFGDRLTVLATGVALPRPENTRFPGQLGLAATTVVVDGASCWVVAGKNPDLVVLFHGYGGSKSDLLEEAAVFHGLGYSVVTVDFLGSGDSPGNVTTLGWSEAEVVANVTAHFRLSGELVLFGKSMGSAAILRAVGVDGLNADALILENPFDRLVTTVGHRFEAMGLPAFPGAEVLVFYGGMQVGFNGFAHNPVEYARRVRVPTLILHGEEDPRVKPEEVQAIADALAGPNEVELFPGAGHVGLIAADRDRWISTVSAWLHAPGG